MLLLRQSRFFVPMILVAAASTPLAGQTTLADSIAVSQSHTTWFRGLLTEDTTMLSAVLAPDVTLGFPGGNVMPRNEFLGYLQSGQLYYDSAEHHDLRMRVYGPTAVVNGRSTLAFRFQTSAGSERLTYTAVYVASDGEWRMVAWQSTIPPRP